VLVFHDTFMDYNHPNTGIAATELFELAGFRVELTNTVCCGRPMISKGFTDQAREQARTNVGRLSDQAAAGLAIVGCEPSCLLTFRSEYPELLRGTDLEEKAQFVAQHSLLFDEFLIQFADRGELEVPFAANGPVLFHAHCQQKAFGTPGAGLALLRLAGYDAEMVNTACCGMAGAFGYEKEHYEQSREAGERDLFPMVRAHPEAQVVVTGFSCRHQIEHFTGRPVLHLAEALRNAVAQETD
jgi:Fe-S oxidoreductase